MGRYAQVVVGPAGSGKSTYCGIMRDYMESNKSRLRPILVNLDPGQERSEQDEREKPFDIDVRDLISVVDAAEELQLGPNGSLVFCMEHLVENLDWLKDQVDETGGSDDEYFIFDCPGQIELYTHIPVLSTIVDALMSWNFNVCVVHVIDALFIDDVHKYISGSLLALTSMMQLKAPAVNVITKCDLQNKALALTRKSKPQYNVSPYIKQMPIDQIQAMEQQFDEDVEENHEQEHEETLDIEDPEYMNPDSSALRSALAEEQSPAKFKKLGDAICTLLDSYNLVNFLPLNITSEESVEFVLYHVDTAIQYGEDLEPMHPSEVDLPDEDGAY